MPAVAAPLLILPLAAAVPAAAAPAPSIAVDGAENVRAVGGETTGDGHTVRTGIVYRSASLSKVTAAGVAALAKLRLGAAVDFRSTGEVLFGGKDVLPAGVTAVAAPIDTLSPSILDLGGDTLTGAFGGGDPAAAIMELSYRGFVHDASARAQFAAALKRIASGDGPVLYHCTAGKDRTGTMTAILLTALGVGRDQVYADYLRSNDELAAGNEKTFAALRQFGIDPSIVAPLFTVRASFLDAAFDQIDRDYGSFDAFLRDGLGIDAATLAELRARLLA